MIVARGVVSVRGERLVLDGVDLEVGAGEAVALTGDSGAGRTTLLEILATIIKASAGAVEINGINLVEAPLRARRLVGYAPAAASFHEDLSVGEYLQFLGAARVASTERREQAWGRAIELVGVDPGTSLRRLSRGQAERLAVASALLPDALVRLLDEPFSAQDRSARATLLDALQRHRRMGETIVAACNRVEEAATLFDRVVRLRQGRICEERPTRPAQSSSARAGVPA